MNNILSENYPNKSELQIISEYTLGLKKQNKISGGHVWIADILDNNITNVISNIKTSNFILTQIQKLYPDYLIKTVDESDEIYYSVSPLDATNNTSSSNKTLVDCHYDSPFYYLPTDGIIFYRIILACNPNKSVFTMFPNNKIKVTMDDGDFHGFDFNKDKHCVDGVIPENNYRILLKLHFLLLPPNYKNYSNITFNENYVRFINVQWNYLSRELMRYSSNPISVTQYAAANLVNYSRIIFNYLCMIILLIILTIVLIYKTKSTNNK